MHALPRPASRLRRARRQVAVMSAGLLAGTLLAGTVLAGPAAPALAAPAAVTPAPAVAFHGYSVFDIHLSRVVSSLSVTRPDKAIHVAGSTGCKVKFHGAPAYQTEWIGNEAGDWLELGTAHQCQNFQYWYAGYGSNGTWFPQWTKVTTTHASHRFWIHGTTTASSKKFTFSIGAKRYATITDNLSSAFGQAGLESYSSATKVPAYSMTLLKYASGFNNTWHAWSGTKTNAPATAPLCERIVSATHVVSGENVQCKASAAVTTAAARSPTATRTARSGAAAGHARPAASTRASVAACAAARRTWGATTVTHSYQGTAGAVRAWREARDSAVRVAYPLLSRAAAAPVAVCYLSGSFSGMPAAPGYHGNYRRLIVLVSESTGALTLDAASHAASWSFGPPPAS